MKTYLPWTLAGVCAIVAAMLALETYVGNQPATTHRAARPISEAPKFPLPPLPVPQAESADGWKPSEELKEPVVELPQQPSSHQSVLRRLERAEAEFVADGKRRKLGAAVNASNLDNRTARTINEQLGTVMSEDQVAEMNRREGELVKLIRMRNDSEISAEECAERCVDILNGTRLTAGDPDVK